MDGEVVPGWPSGEVLGMVSFVPNEQAKAAQDAKDDAARAFVVLEAAYKEVCRRGAALWQVDERFPSLFSVRVRRPRTSAEDTTGTDADTDTTETT